MKRTWKKTIRVLKGRLYITLSNCRVKKRDTSGYNRNQRTADKMRVVKGQLYEKCEGVCPHCGQKYEIRQMELHHILPWSRFPELRGEKRNMILLCHYCHKEIHCNPFKNIGLIKDKASEFGIDIKEHYELP